MPPFNIDNQYLTLPISTTVAAHLSRHNHPVLRITCNHPVLHNCRAVDANATVEFPPLFLGRERWVATVTLKNYWLTLGFSLVKVLHSARAVMSLHVLLSHGFSYLSPLFHLLFFGLQISKTMTTGFS